MRLELVPNKLVHCHHATSPAVGWSAEVDWVLCELLDSHVSMDFLLLSCWVRSMSHHVTSLAPCGPTWPHILLMIVTSPQLCMPIIAPTSTLYMSWGRASCKNAAMGTCTTHSHTKIRGGCFWTLACAHDGSRDMSTGSWDMCYS